jgi:hypothetical protein
VGCVLDGRTTCPIGGDRAVTRAPFFDQQRGRVTGIGARQRNLHMCTASTARYRRLAGIACVALLSTGVTAAAQTIPVSLSQPGWYAADIGAVGRPGTTTQLNHAFRVEGAGSDIWGLADSFQFAYTSIDGDADLYVLVRSESSSARFAKAGVMIRESLDPSSLDVTVDVKPDGGIEVMSRSVRGGDTTFIAATSTSFPVWLRLSRVGTNVAAFMSTPETCSTALPSCSSWTLISNGWIRWSSEQAMIGMAVTSHDPSTVNTAVLDASHMTSLAAPWRQTDLSSADRPPDNARTSNGTFSVPGAGSDIWGVADAFRFVWQKGSGDSEIVARVTSEQDTSAFAKAGLMMRQDLGPAAAHVILDVKPGGGLEFMARPVSGAETTFIAGGRMLFPGWLKLVRHHDEFTGYRSTDGSQWVVVGRMMMPLNAASPAYYAGLAVTSHNADLANTAVYDNVSLLGLAAAFDGANLLEDSGFEEGTGPALGADGWVSDDVLRHVPALSETRHPHGGAHNGACRTTASLDCGIYQEVSVPSSGLYRLTFYADADRTGGLVGVNVNGTTVNSVEVEVGRRDSDRRYIMGITVFSGDTVRVWMYSPATPGSVVIDDVTLTEFLGPR